MGDSSRSTETPHGLAGQRTQKLNESGAAEFFATAFRTSRVAILITRVEGALVVDANPSFLKLCGLERDELIGRPAGDLGVWQDPTHRTDLLATILEFGSVHDVEASFRHKSGELRRGLLSAELATLGADRYIIWQALDITERKRVELALKRSQERFRSLTEDILDRTPVGTIILDPYFRIVWVSQPIEGYFGIPRIELLGEDMRKLLRERIKFIFVDPNTFQEKLLASYEDNTYSESFELQLTPGEGRRQPWLQHWSQPIRSGLYAGGRIEQYTDISERKHAEAEHSRRTQILEADLARATSQLMRAVRKLSEAHERPARVQGSGSAEELAASVAHSIRNPLAALIGTAQMSLEGPSRAKPALERILKLAWRIKDLIDRTLTLFQQGTANLSLDDPGDILEKIRAELAERASAQSVRVELRIASALPSVTADRTLLRTALQSIAENALEAMPEGGTLWLCVSAAPERRVVEFEIMDTGPGIPDELRERVFEPFFSTKGGGIGLGLSIARGVIRGHQGQLRMERAPAGGTRVLIELPLSEASP